MSLLMAVEGVNPLTGGYWAAVRDSDPRVVDLYSRHYSEKVGTSRYARLTSGIGGPNLKMALITNDGRAAWVWRWARYRKDGQTGIECALFRNEGRILSSLLILEAEQLAWARWPGQRLFTYVWDAKVRSVNPGYCYKVAGWKTCGRNKDGRLTILEKFPEEMN